ncbi:MAG: hypothetical protein M5U14_16455 [Acidimicrobiia bacterium]|nr:hypothetical protein [Acidimicrobiia bacterium]
MPFPEGGPAVVTSARAIASCRAVRIAAAEGRRAEGSRARARATTASRAGGTSGRSRLGGGGSVVSRASATATSVSPPKGSSPASIS